MKWIEIYEKLVNIDTGPDLPFEEKLRRTSFLTEILEDLGFRVEKRGAAYVAFRGKPPYVTLIGHLDTVFPEGESKRRPFTIEGNIAKGPGVCDMKGGVVILLESLKRFLQQNDTDLCVVLNVDEELGSPLSGEVFKEVSGMSSHCLSFEPGRENGEFISSRKGIISLWLFARGKKGHASRLDEGANAIVELAFKAVELFSLNGRFPNLTLNPTIVKGGAESNVTPDKAEVYFDVRYYDDKEYEFLEETLKRLSAVHPEANVSYTLKLRRLPMKEDPDFVNIVKMSAEEIGMTVSFVRATGGGDVAFFSQNGVPSIDGLGIPGGKMHSEDEYARLDQFEDRVNLVVHLLRKLGGEKNVR
ncbi:MULTISPECIES: M20 family metallopeptidase [unclassified Thermotoga]|jgi:glutamate carboxypeptidase|uniref:M20 family metallopeptidase n=1 Tax=unclassified Thermotoga TaxID=2631113 RepID=UPI000280EAE6|nr:MULTISPECIES: M20 family metallopeptidase [unclassified Thermotoga]AIY86375.1 carboxypeptidase G2 [Thermotoga sp. 2812B]EJX26311.1 carboxypeptidase G2 [Thermotoga sp. EMP]KAF2959307.1 peptidase M20 [Thermotoga sp. 38H-to]